MVQTLQLRATQDGVIWPRRPLVSSKGLLSCIQNLPLSSHDKRPATFRAVTFNATGDLLAATDERGRIFVFVVTTNRYSFVQHLGVPSIYCCFNPKRKTELLVTCEDETVRCIDVHSQTLVSTLRGHKLPARCASFQKSGQLALTASQDAVILWDTKDWSRYRVLNAGPGVAGAIFVTKGHLVAVCFQDDTIMMWELESLALKYRFSLPEKEESPGLQKIAVSDDHKVLVASGRAPSIYVWGFESQTIIRIIELPPPIKQVQDHAFLPGHTSMISILGDDGGIFFLDVAVKTPQISLEISNRERSISTFDIECHGRYLAASTSDGFLLLYDMHIARETAARAQAQRRKEGLVELGEHAGLHTRSGLQDVNTNTLEQSRPVPSKLINSLFGVKHPRQAGRAESSRMWSASTPQTQVKATTQSSTREATNENSPATQKHRTRRTSPLSRPSVELTAQEFEMYRKRLVGSLKCNGKYPKKYRVLVWRFLLRLPKNEEAFRALVAKGKHPVFVRLKDQYPLHDGRLFRRLHRILSAIVFWCPAFGELNYLPAVVYPFVKIFRENDLAAFEATVSVMLHWCRDFLVNFPYPPVFALGAIEKELAQRDAQLFNHFTQFQVTSEAYAWSLLQTIFTEVLSEDEWMCLWDHLFTYSDTPQLLFVAVLAYLSYFRAALLAACDRFSIEQFFHQQNAIQIEKFIQLMMNLRDKLDLSNFTAIKDQNGDDSSAQGKSQYWPLSRGQYPAFAHYPRFVLDFQVSERNRIALEEAEVVHKQQLLNQVEDTSKKLKAEHDKWIKERKLIVSAEEQRQKEAIAAEKERLLRLKTLDYETRKRRLEYLSTLETSARETLEEAAKLFQSEFQRLENTLAMQKERMEFELLSRKEEEDLQRIEMETHDRVQEIYKDCKIEERLSSLRTEFESRAQQQVFEMKATMERWKKEDAEQAREATIQSRENEERALQRQEHRLRQDLDQKLSKQELEKDKAMMKLKAARHVRRQERQQCARIDHNVHTQRDAVTFQEHITSVEVPAQRSDDNLQECSNRELNSDNGSRQRDNDRANHDEASNTAMEKPAHARDGIESNANNVNDVSLLLDNASDKFDIRSPLQGPPSSESDMSSAGVSMPQVMPEMKSWEKAWGESCSSSSQISGQSEEKREQTEFAADSAGLMLNAGHGIDSIMSDKVPTRDKNVGRCSTPESSPRAVQEFLPMERETVRTPQRIPKSSHVRDADILTSEAAGFITPTKAKGSSILESQSPGTSEHNDEATSIPRHVLDVWQVQNDQFSSTEGMKTYALAHEEAKQSSIPQDFHVDVRVSREEPFISQLARREDSMAEEVANSSRENSVLLASKMTETGAAYARYLNEDSDSSSDDDARSTETDAFQRPIAELEQKLGIRFDDISDDDESIEDDRVTLLQRAQRLLELSNLDTDSDDDDL